MPHDGLAQWRRLPSRDMVWTLAGLFCLTWSIFSWRRLWASFLYLHVPSQLKAIAGTDKTARACKRVGATDGEESENQNGAPNYGIVLFYEYAVVEDVPAMIRRVEDLCRASGLSGRLRISEEGFNGNLSGSWCACQDFVAVAQDSIAELHGTDIKLAPCEARHLFRGLKVWESSEVCGLFAGMDEEQRRVAARDLAGVEPGQHLSPKEWHEMVAAGGSDMVFFDVRNRYETRIGHFARRDASGEAGDGVELVDPNTRFFSETPAFLEDEANLAKFRGKRVMMYCTGGVRCERTSALLKQRLADDSAQVYQLEGGIQRYFDAFPDGGYFEGSMHVFDRRGKVSGPESTARSDLAGPSSTTVVGHCLGCGVPWDRYQGKWRCCVCDLLILVCSACQSRSRGRGELKCELCEPRSKPTLDPPVPRVVGNSSLSSTKLVKPSALPERLEAFPQHVDDLSSGCTAADLQIVFKDLLKCMGSKKVRCVFVCSARHLRSLRLAVDLVLPPSAHFALPCVLSAAEVLERLLGDKDSCEAIARVIAPELLALPLLRAQPGLAITWRLLHRLAVSPSTRPALVADAASWTAALRDVCPASREGEPGKEAMRAIRALAEGPANIRCLLSGAGAEAACAALNTAKSADASVAAVALAALVALRALGAPNLGGVDQAAEAALKMHSDSAEVQRWSRALATSIASTHSAAAA